MGSAIRKSITEAGDLSHRDVEIPEWGVTIRCVSPDYDEYERVVLSCMGSDGAVNPLGVGLALAVLTATDPETGDKVFEESDTAMLRSKNGKAVQKLINAAMIVSGWSEDAVESGKDG